MVLPRVHLSCHTTYPRAVVAHHNEEVFSNKTHVFILSHDFDMCESLTVGTYFVLALDDEYSAIPQYPVSLSTAINVQFKNSFVIFAPRPITRAIVAVVAFVWILARVRGATRGVHIWRVEHHAIYVSISVWKITTVGPVCNVGWQKPVSAQFYILPEHTLAIGDISYNAAPGNIEFQDFGEHVFVGRLVCAQDKIVSGGAVSDDPFGSRSHVCVLTATTLQDIP